MHLRSQAAANITSAVPALSCLFYSGHPGIRLILLPVTTENQFSMRRDHAQANAASAMRHSMYSGMSHRLIRAFAEFHNVMLQLHRSGATVETRTAAAGAVRDNLQTFFNSEPLLTEYTD